MGNVIDVFIELTMISFFSLLIGGCWFSIAMIFIIIKDKWWI